MEQYFKDLRDIISQKISQLRRIKNQLNRLESSISVDEEIVIQDKILKMQDKLDLSLPKIDNTKKEKIDSDSKKVEKKPDKEDKVDEKETTFVPDVVGLTQEEAETLITDEGLTVDKTSEEPHDTIEEGHVISSSPIEGEEVEIGSKVSLVISSGEETKK